MGFNDPFLYKFLNGLPFMLEEGELVDHFPNIICYVYSHVSSDI